jgi:hypothetical protein
LRRPSVVALERESGPVDDDLLRCLLAIHADQDRQAVPTIGLQCLSALGLVMTEEPRNDPAARDHAVAVFAEAKELRAEAKLLLPGPVRNATLAAARRLESMARAINAPPQSTSL